MGASRNLQKNTETNTDSKTYFKSIKHVTPGPNHEMTDNAAIFTNINRKNGALGGGRFQR